MDYSKLKKRPAFPFETIAVAVSFSPRLEAVLCEAKRISNLFGAQLVLLHVGDKTLEKEELLDAQIKKAGIDKNKSRLIWMDGEPIDTILKLCKLNIVDLLILGAIEKENLFRFYVGSIARTISRRAKCSVLLLTQPSNHPKRFKKIIVNGVDNPKTVHTVKTVLYISKHEKLSEFTIVQEDDLPVLSMTIAESSTAPEATKIKKEMMQEENLKLQKIVDALDKENINVNVKTVHGKPGYAISQYAKQKDADLLVFNSPDTHLGIFDRIFTHDIEYALANLPCNLLIVHSRV
ncbi:MAG TPA: universal stress protein [Bacteroidia bacterium]|nr:universal stress protein [Bacteroidia bacterium]